jgi:hypothetical protein
MQRISLALLFVALLAAQGCGYQRSRIEGTIKHKGKPLGGAVVTFFGPDNMTYTADTKSDGTYDIDGVPQGTVRVSIQLPPPRPKSRATPDLRKERDAFAKGQAKADDLGKMARQTEPPQPTAPPASALPAQYGSPSTSGLSFELKEPVKEYSVDLK